jgi:tRNA pseudouridine55 synthase
MGAVRSGYLLIDKPAGRSSFSAVQNVRRTLGVGGRRGMKAGHAGTLDPFATGLLVVALGRASRLLRWCVGHDKRYEVTVQLGSRSTTDDCTGEIEHVTDVFPAESLVVEAVQGVCARDVQVPSTVSAVHIDGERAYKRARRGETVVLAPRPVRMESTIRSYDPASGVLAMDVRCGAGAYMRALARDVGEMLGTGAHVTALRRTEVGAWDITAAVALDDVTAEHIRPPIDLLGDMPTLAIGDVTGFCVGRRLPVDVQDRTDTAVVGPDGELLGVAEVREGVVHPRVVVASPENEVRLPL